MTQEEESKRFEYFWIREDWGPETVQLIQSWGDTLAALGEELFRRKKPRLRTVRRYVAALEELKASTTLETIVAASSSRASNGEELWQDFEHAVQCCSGMRAGFYEAFALHLLKAGEPNLAFQIIAIEEFFEPETKGIARHHLEALTGNRRKAIRALVRVAWDPQRKWSTRIRALECLGELDQDEFAEESTWALTAAWEDGDAHAASDIRSLIERHSSGPSKRRRQS